MQFICLAYHDVQKWGAMPETEQRVLIEECYAYDDELRRGNHFLGRVALESSTSAVTLRMRNSRVVVTDGPFVETKEHLGGILLLEARDLNHAIALVSNHPGIRVAVFEIQSANEPIYTKLEARKHESKRQGV